MNHAERREGLRQLAELLTAECAGRVPPGQMIALVFRTHFALATGFGDDEEFCMAACEAAARSALRRRMPSTGAVSSARVDLRHTAPVEAGRRRETFAYPLAV